MSKKRKTITAYKGFDQNLRCRGFQYEIGGEYEHEGKVEPCVSGFHACENPLDVFGYYPPGESRFCVVEIDAEAINEGDKHCSPFLSVTAELSLPDFVGRAVNFILDRIDCAKAENESYSASTNTGDYSASTNTGDYSASTNTGDYSASTNTGHRSASTNTGYRSASTNTGDYSASTNTGDYSASTNTGDYSASTNTGHRSASTNTGHRSASTNTGDYSASTNTGYRSASTVEGCHSVAIATGYQSRAKASEGSSIMLVERNSSMEIVAVFAGIAGRDGLKADAWYTLEGGKPKEIQLSEVPV